MSVGVKMWSAKFHRSSRCWVLIVIQGSRSLEIATVMPVTEGLLLLQDELATEFLSLHLTCPPSPSWPEISQSHVRLQIGRLSSWREKLRKRHFNATTFWSLIHQTGIFKNVIWFTNITMTCKHDVALSSSHTYCIRPWHVSTSGTACTLEKVGWVQDPNTSYVIVTCGQVFTVKR